MTTNEVEEPMGEKLIADWWKVHTSHIIIFHSSKENILMVINKGDDTITPNLTLLYNQ